VSFTGCLKTVGFLAFWEKSKGLFIGTNPDILDDKPWRAGAPECPKYIVSWKIDGLVKSPRGCLCGEHNDVTILILQGRVSNPPLRFEIA